MVKKCVMLTNSSYSTCLRVLPLRTLASGFLYVRLHVISQCILLFSPKSRLSLLTFGEPCAPVIGEETFGDQQTLSRESKTFATDYSTEEIENVAVVACAEKRFESQVVCIERG
jgi:hypothetical protein